jgi:hypothetical protein
VTSFDVKTPSKPHPRSSEAPSQARQVVPLQDAATARQLKRRRQKQNKADMKRASVALDVFLADPSTFRTAYLAGQHLQFGPMFCRAAVLVVLLILSLCVATIVKSILPLLEMPRGVH